MSIKADIQTLEQRLATEWKNMPKGWTNASREKFWDSLTGDVEHKRTKCHDKVMSWVKDDDKAWAFCQSLWDEFEK